MDKICLKLKAAHFANSSYMSLSDNPIAIAYKEEFPGNHVSEKGCRIVDYTKSIQYNHQRYDKFDFLRDYRKARDNNFDQTDIIEIELSPASKII